ncbi:DUF2177 family protein [Rhodoferax sp.]|uniref:DUF2177 family protein n=1 Tax=Rhodoferax sp. TaxID=50421 RepID=UPI00374D05A5
MRLGLGYVATVLSMLVLDAIWLGLVATPWYQQGIGHLTAAEPNFTAAIAFYLLYALGLLVFAVVPNVAVPGVAKTAAQAAFFGLLAYGTYDLSNLATLRNWPLGLSLLDMAWGSFVSALAASAGKGIFDKLAR